MITIQGKGVAKGIAKGPSYFFHRPDATVTQVTVADVEAEKARIEKDIKYYEGFKASVEKKLSNERFVNNAPEAVVAGERKKLDDANTKLAALRATLAAL